MIILSWGHVAFQEENYITKSFGHHLFIFFANVNTQTRATLIALHNFKQEGLAKIHVTIVQWYSSFYWLNVLAWCLSNQSNCSLHKWADWISCDASLESYSRPIWLAPSLSRVNSLTPLWESKCLVNRVFRIRNIFSTTVACFTFFEIFPLCWQSNITLYIAKYSLYSSELHTCSSGWISICW